MSTIRHYAGIGNIVRTVGEAFREHNNANPDMPSKAFATTNTPSCVKKAAAEREIDEERELYTSQELCELNDRARQLESETAERGGTCAL
jgi:hypothetical protein